MAQILHHIHVDPNGKATVRTTDLTTGGPVPDSFVLTPGDEVIFTSNRVDTEIRYPNSPPPAPPSGRPASFQAGSPFATPAAGARHKVDGLTTPLKVKTRCTFSDPFHFDCGRALNGAFSEWGAQTGHAAGGNTPGPED